jgi:hypothetical protein
MFLTFILLLVLMPFIYLARWFRWIKQLPPHEQALARASHGAGLIAFALLFVFARYGNAGSENFFTALAVKPDEMWLPALLSAVLGGWGFIWFVVGVSRAAGLRDGLLATRAFFKLVIGGGASYYLLYMFQWPEFGPVWLLLAVMFVFFAAVWCLITGTVKFLLLTVGGGGNALRMVDRHIREKEVVFRPVGGRRGLRRFF